MRTIIPEEPIEKAHTVGKYNTDKSQSIIIQYENSSTTDELWQATPSCKHEIQAQRAGGVRCRKCGGWCAF